MKIPEPKKSIMRTVFGRDFHDKEAVEKAKRDFEEQKKQQKISLISNYSVPNAKEDIYEFFILAISNIEAGGCCKGAWLAKLEQAYQKAKLVFDDPVKLDYLTSLYDKVSKKQKIKKLVGPVVCAIGVVMMIIGSLFEEMSGLAIGGMAISSWSLLITLITMSGNDK